MVNNKMDGADVIMCFDVKRVFGRYTRTCYIYSINVYYIYSINVIFIDLKSSNRMLLNFENLHNFTSCYTVHTGVHVLFFRII